MTEQSRAKELVESYPHTVENYPKVVEALKQGFGKEKLLIQVYVRELLSMVIMNSNSREKITTIQMYDKLESHLRALESLGVTSDQTGLFLYPIVESSLPEDILTAWQRSPSYGKDGSKEVPQKNELDYLMQFLRVEGEGEERRSLAKTGFGASSNVSKHNKKMVVEKEEFSTAAGLFTGHTPSCVFCEKSHDSQCCINANSMSLEAKQEKLKNKKACFTCLKPGHQTKVCKASYIKCCICFKKHLVQMCPELPAHKKMTKETKKDSSKDEIEVTHSTLNCTSEVLLQTLTVTIKNEVNNKQKRVRLLCDPGSQRSYILRRTAEELGFESSGNVKLCHMLFGNSREVQQHSKFHIQLRSIFGKFSRDMEVLDHKKMCGTIPRMSKGSWMEELKKYNIQIHDVGDGSPDIEVLIGSDYYPRLLTGKSFQLKNGLTALETYFGWTLSGKQNHDCEDSDVAMTVTSMFVNDASVSELWSLETIGICDPAESKSKEEKEEATKRHFLKTVTRSNDGRYTVSLPWINGVPKIPDNRFIAEKRLISSTAKLQAMGKYKLYDDIFKAWQTEGIIEEVLENEQTKSTHYLPHRAVLKPESLSTPIRPVFDASCKSFRSPSLNDCLEKGPNLLELIPSILLRFREGKIGVVSDIRKAFLMIDINKEDRDFLRFLWWGDPLLKKFKIYRHRRVVFGVTCGPFLLGAVIEFHLSQIEEKDKEVANKLLKSLYVDNCVTSVDSLEEYEWFREKSTKFMADAKMELRQWEYSFVEASRVGQLTSSGCGLDAGRSGDSEGKFLTMVLGLNWNKKEDSFCCVSPESPERAEHEQITKRKILSYVQKIFDPVGFLCPVLLTPKRLLQTTWAEKLGWDVELQGEARSAFIKWCADLHNLNEIKIPRNFTGGVSSRENWEIHTFCDASESAYAAVVYLRTVDGSRVSVELLLAKSRVSPLKKVTIPRLELLACTVGSRLTVSIIQALSIENVPIYYWSDSSTALAWIKRNDDWGTFVGNRVKEICKLTRAEDWRHVSGVLNPADLPSRGCLPKQLVQSRWWEGPDWLKKSPECWPCENIVPDENIYIAEKRKGTVSMAATNTEVLWYANKFSCYMKTIRVIAWIKRFCDKLRKKSDIRGDLTVKEIKMAELMVFKFVQEEVFHSEISESDSVSGLRVVKMEDGLIHVKAKLTNRKDTMGFRFPILLPNSHPIVEQLIRHEHFINGHGGTQFLMGRIREKCWIVHGRRAIRKIIGKCVKCRRFTTKAPITGPVALPENRVKTAKAFETTGVDLAGPLYLKDGGKVWIVLFTCAVFRGIHLELVPSINTEDFIDALDRFVARRGRPTVIYSDNGTNFVGAARAFREMDWEKILQKLQVNSIVWKFNPPTAAWWGGWWERLIGIVKNLLRRMLGRAKLNVFQLETRLCAVEAIVNARPLTFVTEDQDDLIPLTRAMFFQDMSDSSFPESEALDGNGLRKSYLLKRKIRDELLYAIILRFRKEYLSQLVQRGKEKKQKELKIGDVVLVGADNKKRLDWPMARIIELYPGKYGQVRTVKVKTSSGELVRPVQRLFPLEVSSVENTPPLPKNMKSVKKKTIEKSTEETMEVKTRLGRRVKVPVRYGQW